MLNIENKIKEKIVVYTNTVKFLEKNAAEYLEHDMRISAEICSNQAMVYRKVATDLKAILDGK